MVSARFTVVPQMARISSGSSEGIVGAESWGAEEAGMESRSASASEEGRPSRLELLLWEREARGAPPPRREGVRLREEWMSPRLFFGVALTIGLLLFGVQHAVYALNARETCGKGLTKESRAAQSHA